MTLLGNIIWFVCAGFWNWLTWTLAGIFWCLTILGIPMGRQCFKIARVAVWPFGKELAYSSYQESNASCLLNGLWFIFGGFEIALAHLATGILLMITIIGLPFASQQFKLARIAMMPFGMEVVEHY